MSLARTMLDQVAPGLTERDLAIVAEVGRFKLMTGGQLERLFFDHFVNPDTGESVPYSPLSRSRGRQAVLRRLVDRRVLARVGERRRGGAVRGSASYLYMLDVTGQKLAALSSAQPRRPYVPYAPNQEHYLAVAELYVRLVEAERRGELALLAFDPEPYCWRSFGDQTLKPDAFIQVGVERNGKGRKGSFFIEVDRADQWGAKISSKLPQYGRYWQYEQELGRRSGQPRRFPFVLFLAPTPHRVAYLRGLVQRERQYGRLFRAEPVDEAIGVLSGG